MHRQIELAAYLPSVLEQVRELRAAADAQTQEIIMLTAYVRTMMDEQYLQEACGIGLARWERMLELIAMQGETAEKRRFRILARINEQLPFSRRRLIQMLDALMGADGYSCELDVGRYTLKIQLTLAMRQMIGEARAMLARIVPANMVVVLSLKYNTHGMLRGRTHSGMRTFLQWELKEGIITNG